MIMGHVFQNNKDFQLRVCAYLQSVEGKTNLQPLKMHRSYNTLQNRLFFGTKLVKHVVFLKFLDSFSLITSEASVSLCIYTYTVYVSELFVAVDCPTQLIYISDISIC